MRQRKPKDLEAKLAALSRLLTPDPENCRGNWRNEYAGATGDAGLYLEIGCGKGQFISRKAAENLHNCYLAVEGQRSVLLRALEKAEALRQEGGENLRFIGRWMRDVEEFFADGELDGIYLNFSDPWPKASHAGRRLTHSRFLDGYAAVLKPDGLLEFKTDDEGLFFWSLAELARHPRFELGMRSEDLHGSGLAAASVTTEYEDRFRRWNRRICYLAAVRR